DFEIIFKETKFKKLKFRFVDAYNYWAGLGEMSFYRKDDVTADVNSVFTDNLFTKLSDEYNSIDKILELEDKLDGHPLKDDYMEILKAAKLLINGDEAVKGQTMTLSQRGDENVQRDERRQIFAGANIDVTGYYVMPGESIEVYLDADKNGILPQVVFAQVGEVDGAGNHRRSLSVGRNIITAPTGTKPFALYFANKALPTQQAYAPIVKFSGESLNTYPVYIHGKTDPEEYIETVKNHTGPNMTDIAGERYLLSCQISEAKIAYVDRGYSPDKTNDDLVKMIGLYDKLAGYDVNDENPIHRPSTALYHYKATNQSGLYACNEHIHYSASSARDMLSGKVTGWGFVHEFGHQIENSDMRLLEVTNNIYSTYVQRNFGNDNEFTGTQKTVDKYFTYNEGTKGFGGFGVQYDFTYGLFERLLVLNQIFEYFGEDSYAQANRLMRENRDKYMSTGSYQSLITALSEATGYDLSSHFEYYNYPVTDATKAFTAQFKPFDKKIRYIAMADYKKKAANVETFNETTKAVIDDVKRNADGFTLSIGTTDHNDAMTAYEIYRDGEFVGFSRSNTYKDTVDASKEYTYEVVAYDYRANESIKSDSLSTNVSYRPELRGYDNITIAINEEFNPLDHVRAFTYNNEAIDIEKVNVTKNTVDNTKNGTYEVKYEVEDREIKVEKTVKVNVVSKYDYLSDNQWTSTKTAWGTPRRNSNLKGRVNGDIKDFEKGFGIHANGEIVYDLGEHNYDNFEALVGVDMTIAAQNNSSIKFKVIADGVTLTETGVIKHADNMVYINVPVKGVKELKIEINDSGNGNTSDHGVIVNPKLSTSNSKPVINVEKSVSVKLGESVEDIIGSYSANDIEDGDLTNNVTVSGAENVNFNKPGKYEVTYSVTDSQGNTVNAVRRIYVLNMKDYSYLSDVQIKSVSQAWNTLKIDKAVSGNDLRLTGEDGAVVTYEKGLGTHGASTIVYDLTDKDYQLFTSYVGVDRAMYNSVGSVVFQVFVDGVKMFDSGLMNSKDKQKFVEVDLTGASELKLVVTDGGNGNGSDHADWADAKVYSGASKIDRTALDNLLSEAESINRADYSEISVVNLESVKAEVMSALMNGYTQEDIESLYAKLSEAKNNLAERVSLERVELKELLKYADTIERDMAEATSHLEVIWYNFETYRNVAKEALNDKSKTDDELVSVIFTLNYFISELKVKTV
ncbi:MAG: NPCBM/NEW2 domain-containing protein, partial [Clostridium sp.]|nr:NPCBM/NEW2 domain-containing protein [Clostridium sp.]